MYRKWMLVCLIWIGLWSCCLPVQAQQTDSVSYYDGFDELADLSGMEEQLSGINRTYGKQVDCSFEDIYGALLHGQVDEAVAQAVDLFCEGLSEELLENRVLVMELLVLVVVAAVFHNYSSVLKFSYVGEQGFYITYMMMTILLMQSFTLAYRIAEDTIAYIRDLLDCLLPAFCMSLMLCSGLATSQMVNSMFVWMLAVVEKVLLVVVLPAIRIYFLIVVLNQINTKDRFSRLAGLIRQGVEVLLKMVITGVIGLNVVKSMLVPVYENARYNVLQKGLSVIPGGSSLSGISTILIGASVLIKNSVGITLTLLLLVLGGIPLTKLLLFYVTYRILVALVQPISDNRVLSGLQGAADSTGMLLRATAVSMVLSVLSVAIVILTTNVHLYAG